MIFWFKRVTSIIVLTQVTCAMAILHKVCIQTVNLAMGYSVRGIPLKNYLDLLPNKVG